MRAKAIEVMAKATYEAIQHPPNGWKAQWNDGAAAALDALLDYLEANADEIPATVVLHAWSCPECGTSHSEAGCGADLPVLWRAFQMKQLLAVLGLGCVSEPLQSASIERDRNRRPPPKLGVKLHYSVAHSSSSANHSRTKWRRWFGCPTCRETFKSEDAYREHYARTHWPTEEDE